MVSPSKGVWAGRTARAMAVVGPIIATRLHSAVVRSAASRRRPGPCWRPPAGARAPTAAPDRGPDRSVGVGARPRAAELPILLEGPGPEGATVRHQGRTHGIDRRQGADHQPLAQIERGRADAALDQPRHRPAARAHRTELEAHGEGVEALAAQVPVRRVLAPGLVAGVGQVIEHCGGHDRRGAACWA